LVDLRDYDLPFNANGGPETVAYAAVWSAVNLANQEHTVNVSFGGEFDFIVVDGFMYVLYPEKPRISLMENVPCHRYTRSDDDSDSDGSSSSDESDRSLIIGLAVGLGIAGLLLLVLLCMLLPWLWERSRRDRQTEATSEYPPQQALSPTTSVQEHNPPGSNAVPVYFNGTPTGAYRPPGPHRGWSGESTPSGRGTSHIQASWVRLEPSYPPSSSGNADERLAESRGQWAGPSTSRAQHDAFPDQ
jgi:hypothetical protein